MSEKDQHKAPERRHGYLDTPEHVIELADAVLEQIGRRPAESAPLSMLTRYAEWPPNPHGVHFHLERHDYDEQTQKYRLDMLLEGESITGFVFRTRGHNTPKIYRLDEKNNEQELPGEQQHEMQDQLLTILTNANKKAASKAERLSADREFERLVGRYILSDLAYKPLAKTFEDGTVTADKAKQYVVSYERIASDIEKDTLYNAKQKELSKIDRAIKNKPDPLVNSRFIDIDVRMAAGIAARELGNEWSNIFDTSKVPHERILRALVEMPKEEQATTEPPQDMGPPVMSEFFDLDTDTE